MVEVNKSDTPENREKIHGILKKTTISATVIVACLIVFYFVYQIFKDVATRDSGSISKEKNSKIKKVDTYYTPTTPWGQSKDFPYVYTINKQDYSVTGTNSCQVYTYENLEAENEYGSTLDTVAQTKPNLNNVFNDFVNGLNHTGGLFSCISEDQINAVNKNRTCLNDNTTHNKCYDNQGSIISPGSSVSYPFLCTNLPKCDGILGSISLNFKINDGKINKETRCIGVSQISLTKSFYDKNQEDLAYYIEDGIINSNSTVSDYYPLTLTSDICNTRDAKQKFLITRYKYGTSTTKTGTITTYIPDPTGIYTSIIYKPLNAYLDMEFSNSGGIANLELLTKGTSYEPGGKYNIVPEITTESGSGGQVVIGVSGELNTIGSFILSEIGNSYTQGMSCYIDGGSNFTGTSSKVRITSVYQTNPQIVLRPLTANSKFQDIKWLFFPPLDLSNERFPVQQRCEFITQVENSSGRFNMVPVPIGENTVFVESNFEGSSRVQVNSGYCSNPITSYPNVTFQNLTPNGKLNPYSFYNYHVESDRGNPPQRNDPHAFELKPNRETRNFTQGQVFQDGNASILVNDFAQNIIQFPSSYFRNTTGSVLSYFPVPDNNVKNLTTNPIYKASDTGLVSSVEVSKNLITQKSITTGTYSGVSVLSAVTSSGQPSKGTSATFEIEVNLVTGESSAELKPEIIVRGVDNPGANYGVDDILTIDQTSIGLSGNTNPSLRVTGTELEKFLFTSIPMDSNYTLSSTPLQGNNPSFSNRDFSVIGTLVPSENGDYLNFDIFDDLVTDRGVGMRNGYLMWMVQLNLATGGFISTDYLNNLNNYLKPPKNLTQGFYDSGKFLELIWVSPDDVQANQYSGNIPAPISLGVSTGQSIEFNFLSGSQMVLNPSPAQIVYGGEIITGNLNLVEEFATLNINTPKEIKNYFLSQKTNINTNVTFLKSLQYQSLNYSTQDSNNVDLQDKIILGKFIPYTSFTPMTRSKDQLETIKALKDLGAELTQSLINQLFGLPTVVDDTLYNTNYTQIVPYGLDGVFNNNIKYPGEYGSNSAKSNIPQS